MEVGAETATVGERESVANALLDYAKNNKFSDVAEFLKSNPEIDVNITPMNRWSMLNQAVFWQNRAAVQMRSCFVPSSHTVVAGHLVFGGGR